MVAFKFTNRWPLNLTLFLAFNKPFFAHSSEKFVRLCVSRLRGYWAMSNYLPYPHLILQRLAISR